MLGYLIVIIRPKNIENRLHTDENTEWLEDTQTKKQIKNIQKPTAYVANAGTPDTEYLYFPLNVEGVTQKGSLLPA